MPPLAMMSCNQWLPQKSLIGNERKRDRESEGERLEDERERERERLGG